MRAATEQQFEQLISAIDEIKDLAPSLEDEPESISQHHSGSGNNIAATGSAHQLVHTGHGEMKNYYSGGGSLDASTSSYNAPVNHQHGSKEPGDL
jgi:hypothetical protein